MKTGDLVTIGDYSFSRQIDDGKLVRSIRHEEHKQFTIVQMDCNLPTGEEGTWQQAHGYLNNIVIQAVKTGEVVFICHRFLRPVPHTWKHGDVFKNVAGVQIYLEPRKGSIVVNLEHTNSGGTPEVQLPGSDTVFLFNIREKL